MNEVSAPAELLSVADLLLLGEYDGKATDYTLPDYRLEEYGYNYRERLKWLMFAGYLRIADARDSLANLTVSALKEILRSHGYKISGAKNELVKRILANIEPEKYAEQVPKFYAATERGRRELEMRSAYIENQKQPYRFLNTEIAAVEAELLARGEYSAEKVFERLYSRDTFKHGAAGDYGLLRNVYYDKFHFLKRHNRFEEGVLALMTVIYLDLSGLSNGKVVEGYENLKWALETRAWSELDKLRTALNLSDDELKAKFDKAVKNCVVELPFTYFSAEIAKEIIIGRLYGQMNLLERYKRNRNKPRANNPNYLYYGD